jgi:hypothetical protein
MALQSLLFTTEIVAKQKDRWGGRDELRNYEAEAVTLSAFRKSEPHGTIIEVPFSDFRNPMLGALNRRR